MNTGGQAFPGPHWSEGETGMTLLDWMAGQALNGSLASQNPESHWAFSKLQDETTDDIAKRGIARLCYDIASAMLAEKARREADHSGDANKMVPDHSPDAGKMAALEAANRELVEALSTMEMWVPTYCENPVVAKALAILAKHKATT